MAIKSCEKTEVNTVELQLTADGNAFEAAIVKAYQKTKGRYNVPGFRKGKAPRHLIEKYYGEKAFYEDALEILYPSLYEEAVQESKIKPVDQPYDLDVPEIGKDGLVLTMKVTVEPEVEVAQYKGLTAEKEEVTVTDDEVQAEIDRALEQSARTVTVSDRSAKDGDTVVIDFEGLLDGAPFEHGKSENYSLELGTHSFIPGFEEQVVGHNTGDEFSIDITFPEDYDPKMAGKAVVFNITLHEIKMKELPVLDDEFVKEVSEFDTVDDYKKDLKAKVLEKKQKTADEAFESAVIETLCENVSVEIPPIMIEKAIDDNVGDFEYRLKMQGLKLEQYLQYLGMNMEQFRAQYKDNAEKQVKLRLALQKVASLEKLEATEDEKNEEIEKYAKAYGVDAEKIKSAFPVSDLEGDIVRRKSMDLIIKNAVSGKAPLKKAAVKKPAAKKAKTETEALAEEAPAEASPAETAEVKKPVAKKPAAKKTAKKDDAKTE